MAIRRAFSIDYEPASVRDEEAESFTDESSQAIQSRGHWRVWVVGIFALILAVLVAAPLITQHDGTTGEGPHASVPFGDGEAPPSLSGSDGVSSADALGTCRDPIVSLEHFSSVEGLQHGAVAADHPLCSRMGTSILRDLGGNAVDAAVTVALCLGVANPASSGIGGGAFILVHADPTDESKTLPGFHDARTAVNANADSGKVTEVVDCREVAPAAAYTNMFLDSDDEFASLFGGLAAGVPAELKGVELAHARHGKLPWAQVVRPAMELAREGAPINPNLAHEISWMAKYFTVNENGPGPGHGLRKLLTRDDNWNDPLQEGDLLKNEKLAHTLEAIMEEGSDALYKGDRAHGLAQEIQNAGGVMTQEDIEAYLPTLRSPVVAHAIQGFSIAGVPPPSSGGGAIVAIARFLAGYDTPLASFSDSLSIHRYVEACRHVFAMRMSLSDPDYNTETVLAVMRDMVEGSYMENLRKATLDNTTLPLSQYGGTKWAQLNDEDGDAEAEDAKEGDRRRRLARRFGYLEDHGTSHFSIVDVDGNAVSMTSSVNTYFGSGIVSESTGIVVNNQMDDFGTPGIPNGFGLAPSESNYIKAGKKPLSSMSPTMIFRTDPKGSFGSLVLVLGASGGPKIITAVAQIFINHIIFGMPLFEATVHARVHDQLI
jgi:gamma-glutamyltranspeptidase